VIVPRPTHLELLQLLLHHLLRHGHGLLALLCPAAAPHITPVRQGYPRLRLRLSLHIAEHITQSSVPSKWVNYIQIYV